MFARLPTELDAIHKKKTPGPGTYRLPAFAGYSDLCRAQQRYLPGGPVIPE